MKIRIHGNSIIFRLTEIDIANLKEKRLLKEETIFNFEAVFSYALLVDPDGEEITVKYKDNCITIFLPEKEAAILTDSNENRVTNTQYNGHNDGLLLLVEKDLQCLHSITEDVSYMPENTQTTG